MIKDWVYLITTKRWTEKKRWVINVYNMKYDIIYPYRDTLIYNNNLYDIDQLVKFTLLWYIYEN